MEVVLIKYKSRYDDYEDIIGIATDMEVANNHIKNLEAKYPYAFGENYGTYSFEKYIVFDK